VRKRLRVRRSPTLADGAVCDPSPAPIVDAVQYYGATKLARMLGADPEQVRRWHRHRKPIPTAYAARIEELVR
jgi:hypothetical protein